MVGLEAWCRDSRLMPGSAAGRRRYLLVYRPILQFEEGVVVRYSASSISLVPGPDICCPHHGSLTRSLLPKPTSLACSIPCISLSTFWKCSAARFPKAPIVVSSTASPIGSPRSIQKHENSDEHRTRQKLAGYVSLTPTCRPRQILAHVAAV